MDQILTQRLVTSARTQLAVTARKPCGHARHCGCCPECQRAQLARWNAQLAQVTRAVSRR
jgi:hypothetical protein